MITDPRDTIEDAAYCEWVAELNENLTEQLSGDHVLLADLDRRWKRGESARQASANLATLLQAAVLDARYKRIERIISELRLNDSASCAYCGGALRSMVDRSTTLGPGEPAYCGSCGGPQ